MIYSSPVLNETTQMTMLFEGLTKVDSDESMKKAYKVIEGIHSKVDNYLGDLETKLLVKGSKLRDNASYQRWIKTDSKRISKKKSTITLIYHLIPVKCGNNVRNTGVKIFEKIESIVKSGMKAKIVPRKDNAVKQFFTDTGYRFYSYVDKDTILLSYIILTFDGTYGIETSLLRAAIGFRVAKADEATLKALNLNESEPMSEGTLFDNVDIM